VSTDLSGPSFVFFSDLGHQSSPLWTSTEFKDGSQPCGAPPLEHGCTGSLFRSVLCPNDLEGCYRTYYSKIPYTDSASVQHHAAIVTKILTARLQHGCRASNEFLCPVQHPHSRSRFRTCADSTNPSPSVIVVGFFFSLAGVHILETELNSMASISAFSISTNKEITDVLVRCDESILQYTPVSTKVGASTSPGTLRALAGPTQKERTDSEAT
jgi:hypothetical protein